MSTPTAPGSWRQAQIHAACLSSNCYVSLANGWWFYPPAVLWLFQPFTHLDPRVANATAVLAAQLCVAIFVWVVARAMRIRDWQLVALWVAAVISFPPVMSEVMEGNLQILLLAISAIWGTIALRRGDWRLGVWVAASWLLVGPAYLWSSNAHAAGLGWPLLRFGAETAFLGTLILWLASLQALPHHGAMVPAPVPAAPEAPHAASASAGLARSASTGR